MINPSAVPEALPPAASVAAHTPAPTPAGTRAATPAGAVCALLTPPSSPRALPEQLNSTLIHAVLMVVARASPCHDTTNLDGFVVELLRRLRALKTNVIIAMYYMLRLHALVARSGVAPPHPVLLLTKRLFLGLLILACKFLRDFTLLFKQWAQVSGLLVETLQQVERAMLQQLDYQLYVNGKVFAALEKMMNRWSLEVVDSDSVVSASATVKWFVRVMNFDRVEEVVKRGCAVATTADGAAVAKRGVEEDDVASKRYRVNV